MKTGLLIPSYCPDQRLISLVKSVKSVSDFAICVVDDGSGKEYASIFDAVKKVGCLVVQYDKNRGKGFALKTGMKALMENFPALETIVTADSDGQHRPKDMIQVALASKKHSDCLVLGVRDFTGENVPPKSRWGNRFSSLYFRLTTKVRCPDTQTGLRGIPSALFPLALEVEGDRYDYEMNFLTTAVKKGTPLHYSKITTVYENNNSGSHFRAVKDACLIYKTPLKFIAVSLLSALIDLSIFTVLTAILSHTLVWRILIATLVARCTSGILNFSLNRHWSFQSGGGKRKEVFRYGVVFFSQMGASWLFVTLLSLLPLPLVAVKIIVDSILFVPSYYLQSNWVFLTPKKGGSKEDMKGFLKRPYRFGICYGVILLLFASFVLLDTFVIPKTGTMASEDTNSSISSQNTVEKSDNVSTTSTSYEDDNITITLTTVREYDTDIYIADVQISDISLLKTAFAQGTYGRNIKETTSETAEDNDAILAINGDYYGFRDDGYVLRNGTLYRDTSNGNEDLAILSDGTFEIIDENTVSASSLTEDDVLQTFSFGPALINNSEVVVGENTEVAKSMNSNPRTAIGMISPLHYIFVVSDGRTEESQGLTLYQLADVLKDQGCSVAYNLDGGGSSTLYFNGEVVNTTTNGRSNSEREVSDIVYVGY